jgi:two-component system, cell cycle sensor histidine kinase and response regulator CckA
MDRSNMTEQFAELALLYRTAPIGLALVDREMRYIRVNDKLAQFNGRPVASHLGKSFAEVVPDMAAALEPVVRRVFETGEPVSDLEVSGATPAIPGEKRDWLVSFLPLRLKRGEIHGVTIVMLDISSRKQTERHLVIQKAYLEQLVEAAPEAIAFVDTKNVVLRINREFTRLFGYDAAESVGRDLDELVVPPEKAEEGHWLDEEAERGAITSIETVRRRKDGKRIEVSLLVSPVNVAEDQIAVYCIYRDITQRKRAEEELRDSEERYRRLVELSPDAVWVRRGEKIIFINSAGVKLLGAQSPDEVIGKRAIDFIHPAHREIAARRMAELQSPGQTVPFLEEKFVRLDGSEIDVEVAATSFKIGKESASQVIVHDLTERKRAERELLAAETRFRLLVEQLPAITYMAGFGADGEWSYVSPQIEAILGFTPAEWMADPKLWFRRLHPEDVAKVIGLEEKSRVSGQPYSAEYRLQARDGKYHWFTDIAKMVRNANGVESLQGVMTDVTETKTLEAQFRQAQKMEAVGQLAGGIAHDFNNLLMVIRGHTDLLLNAGGAQPRENIVQIQKAADRAASLTRQLLAFSRMQVLQPEVLDLNRVVAEMASMIERLFGSNIEFIFNTEPELGRVRADAGQIEQVLLNLAVNARDAMPGGGCLRIRTENVTFAPGDARALPAIGDGKYAALIVRDTGEGMDAETQARIFEPFFTTKEKGRGTGLGLATVYGIVKQSGGFIVVDSAPAQGTAFTIYLPRVDGVESVAKAAPTPEVARHGAETILVVDDESGIRDLAAEYLEGCGYTVLTASGGIEARDLLAKYGSPIHVLLTDTVMPRMTGHELVQTVSALRPEIKIIYMSGYLEFNASAQIQSGDGALYIQKPFSLDALGKIVRSALESAAVTASRHD